ncbi:hypothetical protein D3C73_1405360 [compost metagenome]
MGIKIFSEVVLLLALLIGLGTTSFLYGYVKQKKIEAILYQAQIAMWINTILAITIALKLIVMLVQEAVKCTPLC